MRKLIQTLALGVFVSGILLPAAFAQGQTKKEKREEALKRPLEGYVTDAADNNIDGAVVKLKDLKTLEVRSFITKEDGKYHFYGLSVNNDYEVSASFSGATCKPRMLSLYDTRKNPNLDLKLEQKK